MRKINFRAWNGAEMDYSDNLEKFFSLYDGDYNKSPLMQYTGMNDKNGIDIYEGDIVKSQYFSESVVSFKYGMFMANDTLLNQEYDGVYEDNTWEVIGNIYENTDTLK